MAGHTLVRTLSKYASMSKSYMSLRIVSHIGAVWRESIQSYCWSRGGHNEVQGEVQVAEPRGLAFNSGVQQEAAAFPKAVGVSTRQELTAAATAAISAAIPHFAEVIELLPAAPVPEI